MMEWTIAILIVLSMVLLAASIYMTKQLSVEEEQKIDSAHISLLKEIKNLKESIYKLQLERDIIIAETGLSLSPEELKTKREVLDYYLRGYSLETIGTEMDLPVETIRQFLEPFLGRKTGRSSMSNEN